MRGGRGGIRTHGTLAGTPVFKTGALNHSATLPAFPAFSKARVAAKASMSVLVGGMIPSVKRSAGRRQRPNRALAEISAAACCRSGQGECQKARAKEHKARRGQRQESAGNDIMVAHVTPATP